MEAAARKRALDADERALLDTIERSAGANNGMLDIGVLLNEPLAAGGPDADVVWRRLQGLYSKRRILVQVAPVRPVGT